MEKSKHHLVPTSKGGSNHSDNIVIIPHSTHVNHHRVFENDTPIEQIDRIVKFNYKALSLQFIEEISHLLGGAERDRYYENGVFRK